MFVEQGPVVAGVVVRSVVLVVYAILAEAGGAAVGSNDLRDILKTLSGYHAELEPEHYEQVTAREIVLRVQNNIRNRLLRADRVEDAIVVIETMLLFAPKATYLWRECGMLHARIHQVAKAI